MQSNDLGPKIKQEMCESDDDRTSTASNLDARVNSFRERMQAIRRGATTAASPSTILRKQLVPDRNGEPEVLRGSVRPKCPVPRGLGEEEFLQEKMEFEEYKAEFKARMIVEEQNLKQRKQAFKMKTREKTEALEQQSNQMLKDYESEYRVLDAAKDEFEQTVRKQAEEDERKANEEKIAQRDVELFRKKSRDLDLEIEHIEQVDKDLKRQQKEFELEKQEFLARKQVLEQEERDLAKWKLEHERMKNDSEKEIQTQMNELHLQKERLVNVENTHSNFLEEKKKKIEADMAQKFAQQNQQLESRRVATLRDGEKAIERKKQELEGMKMALKKEESVYEKKKKEAELEKAVLREQETKFAKKVKEFETRMETVKQENESKLQKLRRREDKLMENFRAVTTVFETSMATLGQSV